LTLRAIRTSSAIAVVMLTLWWGGRSAATHVVPIVNAVHRLGPLGPALFILVYMVAVVAFVPGSWFTFAGGAVFGLLPAAVYGLVGATIGSTLAFLLGRHAARRFVARHLMSPRFEAIDRAVCAQGRRIVFLLRLSPFAPFNLLNYALGLTTLSVRDFLIASAGMIPGTFLYAYAGAVAGHALVLAGQAEMPRTASYYAMLVVGLAATVAATTLVTRTARRALRDV
jgi:uncharacterized membrane protein YdjX (TVP38/TMEM64 family)